MTNVEMADDKSRVFAAVKAILGNHDRAVAWLQEPLVTFAGKTALELIAAGRTDAVLRYLASIASGFVG
ncbi:MAG TPA: MbcA/ParS/Xre antitoxin family protein [Steroidobacteraceae bacterium]